ncbi:MAG: flagellar protein FlaG [Synergistaceae bacterium]|nr:flagellar protein FlaG [Synergistota bacterium]NLM70371.1 flagellar protein FlaG [Synergistaceae bacterium]
MTPAFAIPSIEVVGWARKNYLEPSYPDKRYDEQKSFSELRARGRHARGDGTLQRALDSYRDHAAYSSRFLQFNIVEEAGLVQVIVKEKNDEEKIIRKIPPDEIVRLIERQNEMIGFLLDLVA